MVEAIPIRWYYPNAASGGVPCEWKALVDGKPLYFAILSVVSKPPTMDQEEPGPNEGPGGET